MNSPTDIRDTTDPGDVVLKKFRYQHAYGVILAIGMASKRLPYISIWCEQHEDILAEMSPNKFDAYQIKTKKAESGEWETTDEAFYNSVNRFIELNSKFPDQIKKFVFVSNALYSNTNSKERECYSPIKLIEAVKNAVIWNSLSGEQQKGFEWLKNKIKKNDEELFSVLKQMELIVGPTERAFDAELCQRHIVTMDDCRNMNVSTLIRVRESLISLIAGASSLVSDDPSRDWIGLTNKQSMDPLLIAKCIKTEKIVLTIRDNRLPAFCYLPEFASLQLGTATDRMDVMFKKMNRGGLAEQYEVMRRRALTAEHGLLELATRPDEGKTICSQIENVVYSECSDSNLRASQDSEPFGPAMLIDVQDRLKRIADTESTKVHHQPYDLLVGVAGLLTTECKVWWSPPFKLVEGE